MVDCTTYSDWLGLLYTLRTFQFDEIVIFSTM
jgi:hypothetical protein